MIYVIMNVSCIVTCQISDINLLQNGVKIFEGTPLPVFSEADVFKYLGIDYLEPHDRDLD